MAINIPIFQLMVGCFWLLWEFLRFYLFSQRISWGLTWRLQKEPPISNSKIVSGSSNNIYYRKLLPPFFYVCGRLVHFWISRRQTFVNRGSTNLVLHCRTMMTKRRVVDLREAWCWQKTRGSIHASRIMYDRDGYLSGVSRWASTPLIQPR